MELQEKVGFEKFVGEALQEKKGKKEITIFGQPHHRAAAVPSGIETETRNERNEKEKRAPERDTHTHTPAALPPSHTPTPASSARRGALDDAAGVAGGGGGGGERYLYIYISIYLCVCVCVCIIDQNTADSRQLLIYVYIYIYRWREGLSRSGGVGGMVTGRPDVLRRRAGSGLSIGM